MPTFLTDPTPTLYILLGTMVIVLGSIALRRQKRGDLISFAIAAAVLVALFLIDRVEESPREEVVRKIAEMGTASRDKKTADVFKHVSESFKYKSLDKKGLQDKARQAESFGFGGISQYAVDRSRFKEIDGTTVEQGFGVKHNGQPEIPFTVLGTFKKDADGQWRLVSFKLYDPINSTDEKDIPGV